MDVDTSSSLDFVGVCSASNEVVVVVVVDTFSSSDVVVVVVVVGTVSEVWVGLSTTVTMAVAMVVES